MKKFCFNTTCNIAQEPKELQILTDLTETWHLDFSDYDASFE